VTFRRGAVYYAEIPDAGDKPVLVVSAEPINRALANVLALRISSVSRSRALPTVVPLEAGTAGHPAESFVICHDVFTLPKDRFRRAAGRIPPQKLFEVERALRVAFAL
jgi:mRNA-degrading endonuclease toxin of MazEF toxin-antitoxin module